MGRGRSGDKRRRKVDNSRLTAAGYRAGMIVGGNWERRLWWGVVGATAAAGLALRVLAAQGGLWTDEAWSMIYAHEAGDPIGVFLRINHDNNHHLNSLWLQAIGMGASPLLARLPAIVAGTACVVVAALIAGAKSRAAGIVAALLFALSPALVTLGSEARGYAFMLLAVLAMLLIVTRASEHGSSKATPWWLALVALMGMLSHLTMAAPVALITFWIYLDRRDRIGSTEALRLAGRLMAPAIGASIAVIALVFAAALASRTGMRVGGYAAFNLKDYGDALDQLSGFAIGLSAVPLWLRLTVIGAGAAAVAIRPPQWLGSRGRLYAILILGIPLAALALRLGNTGFARYYVTSLIGLYLLIAAFAGRALAAAEPVRWAAAALLLLFAGLNLAGDVQLMHFQRGRPDAPVADMVKLAPAGASISVDRRYEAILTVAATRARYPARFTHGCEPAEFLLVPRPLEGRTPETTVRCGLAMRAIDMSSTTPMTGDPWVVYRAESLQTLRPPVSGPPPGAT